MSRPAALIALLLLSGCGQSDQMAPAYTYRVGSGAGAGSLGIHTVQKGDTLWTIARRYDVDMRGIIETNRLEPPYRIGNGARLRLPAPQTYTVRANDSLYSVSRLFNTTQTELASLNRLRAPFKIRDGQVLRIPHDYGDDRNEKVTVPAPRPLAVLNDVKNAKKAAAGDVKNAKKAAAGPAIAAQDQVRSGNLMPPQPSPLRANPKSLPPVTEPQKPVVSAPDKPRSKGAEVTTIPAREGKFLKPVSGKVISGYGPKPDGQHNDGINIQAARGDAVRASESGQVVYVGNEIEGYGNMILLRHADRYMTAYAHMQKTLVKKGDNVRRGQTIGTVGATGLVDTPQLHFEIRKGKKAVNPNDLL